MEKESTVSDSSVKKKSAIAALCMRRSRAAAGGVPVDVFNASHIEQGSLIDREIRNTGVVIYEK